MSVVLLGFPFVLEILKTGFGASEGDTRFSCAKVVVSAALSEASSRVRDTTVSWKRTPKLSKPKV